MGRAPSLGTLPGCSRSAPGTLLDTSRATTAVHSELMDDDDYDDDDDDDDDEEEDEEELDSVFMAARLFSLSAGGKSRQL